MLLTVLLLAFTGAARAQSNPRFDWSGFYIGGNVGAVIGAPVFRGFVEPSTTYFNTGTDSAQMADAASGTLTQGGFTGGVVAGYNVQHGNMLLGLEAGANVFGLNASRTGTGSFLTDPNVGFGVVTTVKSNWMATLRPRLGWVRDNWLLYVTGGVALTQVQLDYAYDDNNAQAGSGLPGAFARGTSRDIRVGWTAGAGGEYALSRNWLLTGQYLYAEFGSVDASAALVPTPTLSEFNATFVSEAVLRAHLVLIGLSYRF